jgi:hypothetical protein
MLVENTLWNRRLADVTEDIVQTLVAQIFEGIRDHIITQVGARLHTHSTPLARYGSLAFRSAGVTV